MVKEVREEKVRADLGESGGELWEKRCEELREEF